MPGHGGSSQVPAPPPPLSCPEAAESPVPPRACTLQTDASLQDSPQLVPQSRASACGFPVLEPKKWQEMSSQLQEGRSPEQMLLWVKCSLLGGQALPTEGPGVSHQLASGGELVQLLRDSGSAP